LYNDNDVDSNQDEWQIYNYHLHGNSHKLSICLFLLSDSCLCGIFPCCSVAMCQLYMRAVASTESEQPEQIS